MSHLSYICTLFMSNCKSAFIWSNVDDNGLCEQFVHFPPCDSALKVIILKATEVNTQ